MRVLHVITDLRTGGAEKLMVDLLPMLNTDDVKAELCVLNGEETPFLRMLRETGISIHSFGNKPEYYNFRHLLRLIKLAKGYDIIHTHNTAPQLFGAIASLFVGKNWITTEHTTTSHRRVWWYRPIERWMYNRYKRIICISDAARDSVVSISKKSSHRIAVVPNGIDLDRFKQASPIGKSAIGRPEKSKIVLLMVGRYSYQKDQATVIRAMSLLPGNTELWLAGYGETESALRRLIEERSLEDRVFLLGMRTDVPQLLKASDIVVQSSHIEGFGMAAVEGMAAGKPVVASDVDGLLKVVDGAGVLFKNGDEYDLANKIVEIMSHPKVCNALIKSCEERAAHYGISRMATSYNRIYDEIVVS